MSRILLYGINYSPELTGIGKFSGEMAEWLAGQGHEVRVVTAPPYYPVWKVGEGFVNGYARSVSPAGVVVWRCPLWVPERPSGSKRLLHLVSFALSSLPVAIGQALRWRPDIVLVVAPALFCAPGAWLAARLGGAKSWLHIQDFELDAAFSLGLLSSGRLRAIATRLEALLLRHFDRVSTISANMVVRLWEKGVPTEKTLLFPNWIDLEAIRPDETAGLAMRRELGIAEDRVVALYSGNMGEKQGLEILLEVAERLRARPDLQFVLCGDGAVKSRLMAQAQASPNVKFLPLQPLDKLNGLLNMADLHLLPQRADAADLVMPSKLTGILASGGVVVASAHSGTSLAKVVAQAGGLTCEPENAQAMSQAVLDLANDAQLREQRGHVARAYAEAHLGQAAILGELERECLAMSSQPVRA